MATEQNNHYNEKLKPLAKTLRSDSLKLKWKGIGKSSPYPLQRGQTKLQQINKPKTTTNLN